MAIYLASCYSRTGVTSEPGLSIPTLQKHERSVFLDLSRYIHDIAAQMTYDVQRTCVSFAPNTKQNASLSKVCGISVQLSRSHTAEAIREIASHDSNAASCCVAGLATLLILGCQCNSITNFIDLTVNSM
jgi:hypothetical protein